MENVRKYYKEIKRMLGSKRPTNMQVNIKASELANETLDGIKNKLLQMPKDVIPNYAKFIVAAVNNELTMFEYKLNNELNYEYLYHTLDLDYLYQRDYEKYSFHIVDIFEQFGVKIDVNPFKNDEDEGVCSDILKITTDLDREVNFESKPHGVRKKESNATTAQQWIVIRTLMECATGWRLTNDENKLMYNKTDIAKFISFLCGGSEEVIRKHLEDGLPMKDINEMIPFLNNVGLHKIAEKIKNDA